MSNSGKALPYPKLRALIVAALLLSQTACSSVQNLAEVFPGPIFADNFPPPGPANYQGGMVDGCKTAKSVMSGVYGNFNDGYVFNVNLGLNDTVYYKAWKDGYNYCKGEHNYYQS